MRSDDKLDEWFGGESAYTGFLIVTGVISNLIVLDCDNDDADAFWHGIIGREMDTTACVKTSKGHHYYFALAEGQIIDSWSRHDDEASFDVQAEGKLVMAPPSPHPKGGYYKWVRDPENNPILNAPTALLDGREGIHECTLTEPLTPQSPLELMQLPLHQEDDRASAPNADGAFAKALAEVSCLKEGDGRNTAMTRLLGPFAGRVHKSVYLQLAQFFNHKFVEPLAPNELYTTAESIWQREGGNQNLLLRKEVDQQRLRSEARRIIAAEEADAQFRAPPFRASLTEDLLAQPEDQPETIVGLHRKGANALLAAQFKVGKTTMIANVARSLADGEPFLGMFDVKFDGRIVILNYELNEGQMTEWLGLVGIRDTDRITVLNLRGLRLPLISEQFQDWMVETLIEYEVKAIILDPFARAFAGCGNENDNGEVSVFTDALDEIKQRANVPDLFLTHHFGRKEHEQGQEHGRGATRLDDWADSRWLLTRQGNQRFLRIEGRGIELPETGLDWDPSGRLLVGTGTRLEAKLEAKRSNLEKTTQRVISAVRAKPGLSTRGIQEALKGTSKATVGKGIKRAIESGQIITEPGPRNSVAHFISETETEGLL